MNREEVKLTLANQFRVASSPIRALMLAPDAMQLNKGGNDAFRAHDTFYVTEFDFGFTVEHLPAKPGEPSFQVCFFDLPEGRTLTEEEELKNLSGEAFKTVAYHVEEIKFQGSSIEFWHISFQMGVSDYYLTNERIQTQVLARFDVNKQQFDVSAPENVFRKMFDASCLFGPKYMYVEYMHHDGKAQELANFLKANHVSTEAQKRYVETFQRARIGGTLSTSMKVFKHLVVLESGQWRD